MYKYAVDNGFADRCKQRGITDVNQVEYLMKVASGILEDDKKRAMEKQALTAEQQRMLIGGLAGGGLGAGLGGLAGGWGGAGLGALAGGGAGVAGGYYTPEIMALLRGAPVMTEEELMPGMTTGPTYEQAGKVPPGITTGPTYEQAGKVPPGVTTGPTREQAGETPESGFQLGPYTHPETATREEEQAEREKREARGKKLLAR